MKTAAKDFKMTELGPIPKDWEVKRFDDCFDFAAAGDLREECYNRERVGNCVYPIFSNSLANKGLYGYTSSPRYKADSITITGRGTLGHAEYRGEAFDAIIRLLILTPKQEVDCRFVVDWINHINPFVNESTSIPQLTVPQVAGSWFGFPPLPEQRKIAAALSDVDEMIAALEKLIEKKRKIKTGAMQRLLTGKTRLPGFKGAWVEKRLGDCGEWLKGQPFAKSEMGKGGLRECVHYGELFTRYHEVIGRIESRTDARPVVVSRRGDILFPASDVTPTGLGRCSALMKDDVVLGGDLIVLRTEQEMHAPFLSYVINLNKAQIIERVTGTTVKHIRSGALAEVSFRSPPTLAEQKAIAKVLGDMDEEIAALEAELAKTRQLKQGMMQELLTGKTRIKGVRRYDGVFT